MTKPAPTVGGKVAGWMAAIVGVSLFAIAFHPPIPWPIEHHERKVSFPDCPDLKLPLSIARKLDHVWCSH